MRALVQLVGEDFHELANEVDKLAPWAGDEPIGAERGRAARRRRGGDAAVALTDAWAQRDIGRRSPRARRSSTARAARVATPPRASSARSATTCVHAPLPAARGRGRSAARRRVDPEAASVLRREALRPGRELLRRRAPMRVVASPRSTTRSREARLRERAGARARARSTSRAASGVAALGAGCRRRAASRLRLLARGGVPVQRAAGRGPCRSAARARRCSVASCPCPPSAAAARAASSAS